eukprot:1187631-Prorocentrum_minimum.AAC.3
MVAWGGARRRVLLLKQLGEEDVAQHSCAARAAAGERSGGSGGAGRWEQCDVCERGQEQVRHSTPKKTKSKTLEFGT